MKKNSLDPMGVVFAVVDSEYPSDIEVKELTDNKDLLESAIKRAEKNGLYYHFINQLRENQLYYL